MPAMEALHRVGITHYVEIGPQATLLAMGELFADSPAKWLQHSSNWRRVATILESAVNCSSTKFHSTLPQWTTPYNRCRVSTPGYQFQKRRLWIDELDNWDSESLTEPTNERLAQLENKLLYRGRLEAGGDSSSIKAGFRSLGDRVKR